MQSFMEEAGFGIYPVLLFGVSAVIVALRHASAPRRRLRTLVNGLCAVTVLAGVLGAVVGVQKSAGGIPDVPPDQRWIFLLGLRESLNNVDAALVLAIVAKLASTVGSFRSGRRAEA